MKPKKLFKIGELIRHTGISRQTLHNYTMLGLIKEAERTESGHRLYDEHVFERLHRIEMLKRHRTLREVKEMLEGGAGKDGGEDSPSGADAEEEEKAPLRIVV